MTQEEFIKTFVLQYPRLYVRLISYNLPFTEENIDKYGFLLAWDKYGLLGNSYIEWTPYLKFKFAKKLPNRIYTPDEPKYLTLSKNSYLPEDYVRNINTMTFKRDGQICSSLKLSELNIDTIRKYKDYIRDWSTISMHYPEVNYDFLIEFKDKIDLTSILMNKSLDWSDTRLYSLFAGNYQILLCENVWTQFVSKYANTFTFHLHLESFNQLRKQLKITWKSPELINGHSWKYFISVYVNCSFGHKLMAAGYLQTKTDIALGKTVEVGPDRKFPISNDCYFH